MHSTVTLTSFPPAILTFHLSFAQSPFSLFPSRTLHLATGPEIRTEIDQCLLTRSYCRQLSASTNRRVSQDGCEVRSAASTSAVARRRSAAQHGCVSAVERGARKQQVACTTPPYPSREIHARYGERRNDERTFVRYRNVRMYERTSERTSRRTYERTNERTKERTNGRTDGRTNERMSDRANGQTDDSETTREEKHDTTRNNHRRARTRRRAMLVARVPSRLLSFRLSPTHRPFSFTPSRSLSHTRVLFRGRLRRAVSSRVQDARERSSRVLHSRRRLSRG